MRFMGMARLVDSRAIASWSSGISSENTAAGEARARRRRRAHDVGGDVEGERGRPAAGAPPRGR
jgi:hypothetical protein